MASKKGGTYERFMAKELSLWYTQGIAADKCWRSAGSGGMATVRAKQGNSAVNQQGDLAPTDPTMQPLFDLVTIELKKGYGNVSGWDILDIPEKNKTRTFEDFVNQSAREAEESGKPFWWLIFKRDRREDTITVPIEFLHKYTDILGDFSQNCIKIRYNGLVVVTMRLEDFLNWFDSETIFGKYKE